MKIIKLKRKKKKKNRIKVEIEWNKHYHPPTSFYTDYYKSITNTRNFINKLYDDTMLSLGTYKDEINFEIKEEKNGIINVLYEFENHMNYIDITISGTNETEKNNIIEMLKDDFDDSYEGWDHRRNIKKADIE